jgi:uncharacterized phage-associated protein
MFNERKAAQIAAYFINRAGGTTELLKLTKLMYLAERRAMDKHGFPMTFDYPVSMPHGPVLSYTLGYVNGDWESSPGGWDHWIRDREGRRLSLAREDLKRDDLDELSDQDVAVLEGVWNDFGRMTASQLRKYTHDNMKEWKDPNGSSRPISVKDIFLALGRSPEAAEAQAKEVERRRKIAAALKAA